MRFDTPPYYLYWFVVVASAIPYWALCLSYRRIREQRIDETAARLKKGDTARAYAETYGKESVTAALEQWSHWTTYVSPVLLVSFIVAGFTVSALSIAGLPLPGLSDVLIRKLSTTSLATLAGAFGAYLFSLDSLVRRHAVADLSPATLDAAWVRISIAAGVGAVLNGAGAPAPLGIPAAFAVGTLPLSEIWALVREKTSVKYKPGAAWESDLYLLQGLTRPVCDRLLEEDIDSIQRLAAVDPVRLLCRTNIEWNVILDLIDQALLVNFVGDKITALRPIGIRGSIEMADLAERSPDEENTAEEIEQGKRMLEVVGKALGTNADAAFNIAYALSNDALVQFTWEQWDSAFGFAEKRTAKKRAREKAGPVAPKVPPDAHPVRPPGDNLKPAVNKPAGKK